MTSFQYPRTFTVALCATLAVVGAIQVTQADEPAKPMVLRTVMQQLERDLQSVTGAISREDWKRVTELAPRIGHHDEPPVREKMRILAWLGTDAGRFRDFDSQAHKAAEAMGEAAMRSDGQAVISAFAKVQQNCLACHANFRKAFREHFDRPR